MAKMDFAWGPFRSGDLPGLLREVPPAPHPVLSGGQYVPAEPAQLRWVVLGGKLFATVPIAAGKWNELNAHQLIAGTEICVDGLRFLVRLPVFGYDTDIFDLEWRGSCWVIDGRNPSNPVSFLLHDAGTGKYHLKWLPWAREYSLPLYPVLEPILPAIEALAGLHVSLMTPNGPAEARLLEVTTYDLALTDYEGPLSDEWGRTGVMTFLSREAVVNIGLAK